MKKIFSFHKWQETIPTATGWKKGRKAITFCLLGLSLQFIIKKI